MVSRETHPDHQTGRRRSHVNQIEEILGTEDSTLREPELSAKTVKKLYEEITGRSAEHFKTKEWHVKHVFNELGINAEYNERIPERELNEILQHLQQHSS